MKNNHFDSKRDCNMPITQVRKAKRSHPPYWIMNIR